MKSLMKRLVLASFALVPFGMSVNAQRLPVIPVPSGFGHYCSVTYSDGTWEFLALRAKNSDPCREIRLVKPGGTIHRAGLWAIIKKNNVLRMCDGDVGAYRDEGRLAIDQAKSDGAGKPNCIFTVAPTALHVFDRPYVLLPNGKVNDTNVFDFDVYNKPLNSTDYGRPANANCPNGTFIDRTGRQRCRDREQAYDWGMRKGTPIVSVAAGIVREARWRPIASCGSDDQAEVYIEHRVGPGEYAERFITYYAHMTEFVVKKNDQVTRGQLIGTAGSTGCANPSNYTHLHFGVFRTTNLSGHREWGLSYPLVDRGVSSIQGVIDPFGWDAPKGIDPWGWEFLGPQNDQYQGSITDPGAFSIYLWRTGQAPPTNH